MVNNNIIDLRMVNEYLKNGAVFRGTIVSHHSDYPTIYLWVWTDEEFLYLAHSTKDDFRFATTEEVEHLNDLPQAVGSIVQEIAKDVLLNRSVSPR
jgi:hypothetical protein